MPATGNFVLSKGYDAAAALTKYTAVKFTAEETVGPVTAVNDVVAGVAQFDVTTAEIAKGKGASIAVEGATVMIAGGTCTVGALAGLMADGKVHDAATGNRIIGMFRQGATVGNQASVELSLPGSIA